MTIILIIEITLLTKEYQEPHKYFMWKCERCVSVASEAPHRGCAAITGETGGITAVTHADRPMPLATFEHVINRTEAKSILFQTSCQHIAAVLCLY